jgi:2-polyprenyl-3-methyl-5-hydroxy-6-metoxy-1,4-benzoquinol methylase
MPAGPATTQYQFRQYTVRPEGHHRYLHPVVLRLLEKYVPEGTPLLDAGCGNGGLAGKIADRYPICGADLSESGIAAARQLCPQGSFEVASVYDDLASLFAQRFGAAVSLEVIEHLYDPPAFMRRLHDAVEPGGIIILSTPYHGYLKNVVMALADRLDGHYHPGSAGGHIKFFSRKTLGRLYQKAGFDVLEFAGCGRLPFLWKSMVLVGRRRPDTPSEG